jgi:hypothetical protein
MIVQGSYDTNCALYLHTVGKPLPSDLYNPSLPFLPGGAAIHSPRAALHTFIHLAAFNLVRGAAASESREN